MKTWIYLSNTFLTVTDGSYRNCKKIGDYTLNALNASVANPPFDTLHASMEPLVSAFNTQYAEWLTQVGSQKGKTTALTLNLKALQGEKIRKWDVQVQVEYDQDSPEYVAILPNRRVPFQTGSQEDRISAVAALSDALDGIAALATLKTDVDDFLTTLQNSFNAQKADKSSTKTESAALDAARKAVCVELYATLGTLMAHFKNTPEEAAAYFDLQTIRNNEQTTFTHNLNGGETRLAITHTFEAEEELRLINKGNTILRYALCAEANDALGATFVEVPAHDERIVPVEDLGDITHRFLKVQNTSETESGRYTIVLL